jgi:hypothetical protein
MYVVLRSVRRQVTCFEGLRKERRRESLILLVGRELSLSIQRGA